MGFLGPVCLGCGHSASTPTLTQLWVQHRENPETMPSQVCSLWLLSYGSHVGLGHPFLTTCVSCERLMAYGGFWWHSRC